MLHRFSKCIILFASTIKFVEENEWNKTTKLIIQMYKYKKKEGPLLKTNADQKGITAK